MLDRLRRLRRGPARAVHALALFALLSGCAGQLDIENDGTVTPATLALMESGNMDRGAPILIRVFKEDSTLEVWKQDRTGRFKPLRSYAVCRFSGGLGPKKAFGDHQAPEGFYEIGPGQMNPHSREYLSFNVGYPNSYDRAFGRTGDSLMVHGGCRSVGCYAMTDAQMDEIFALAHESFAAGQSRIQFQAYPFRMTESNLARHAADPDIAFWQELKAGSDAFAATALPPKVAVCDRHYAFAPAMPEDATASTPACPAAGGMPRTL